MAQPDGTELLSARSKSARQVISKLGTPWPALFVALEQSAMDDVVVLRLEPDVARQELRVTADAGNIVSALIYANALQSTGTLHHVYLASQRAANSDPAHPVQVVLVSQWKSVPATATPLIGGAKGETK